MKKLFGVVVLAATLAGCGTVDINKLLVDIQANAKQYCGVVVNLADLAVALSGQDPKVIAVTQVAHSICDQYKSVVQGSVQAQTSPTGCVSVQVNNKPLQVCK